MELQSPYRHRCSEYDCYYVGNEVECAVCGRIWVLDRYRGYTMVPLVRRRP